MEPPASPPAFSPPAEAPPADSDSLEDSLEASEPPASDSELEDSPLDSEEEEVEVFLVVVDDVVPAAFSALVSFGGVISGVFLGAVSETLVPPQAARASAASSAPPVASHRRVLTAGPSAGRRWGSR